MHSVLILLLGSFLYMRHNIPVAPAPAALRLLGPTRHPHRRVTSSHIQHRWQPPNGVPVGLCRFSITL